MNKTDKQMAIGLFCPMAITDYLISIHEDWKFILSDEPEKQLTLFGGEDYR